MAGARSVYRATIYSVAAAAIVSLCSSCGMGAQQKNDAEYCAIMPDSVGLYVGNPVTQMGYEIGKVTAITPAAQDVRVEFVAKKERRLPQDARAVIRSTSLLADRSLELVGNYKGGPELAARGCIPLVHSSTPKSLSEVLGSATTFINSINPSGSNNIGDVVGGIDKAVHNLGPGTNNLLTGASAILDSPDRSIGDIGAIIKNLALLTSTAMKVRGDLKVTLMEGQTAFPYAEHGVEGGAGVTHGIIPLLFVVADIEKELGNQIQQTLDIVGVLLRKLAPRAPYYASLLNAAPRWITGLANIANNHQFSLRYRPPLYRVRTPDGVAACNMMNASVPGSCANVQGTPYAVDVALLQYVLMQAHR